MLGNDKGWFNEAEANDLWRLLTGKCLGEGCYRKVFEFRYDPSLVIKVEQEEGCFHNVREWDAWQTLEHAPKWRRWLAPCVAISPRGNFLLQRRTTPVAMKDMPRLVPAFFTDKKVGNWGRLNGRIVCHDYANSTVDYSLRLVKGAFWDN